ncbi:hypothetical protein [Pseudomonas phage vB_PsaM_M1]|nr:hypothetical protein [Pseudomonas phage vB_PsaM_M1]
MIFKKKYKRSAWFEGLLQAEELLKEGYQVGSTMDEPLWFTKVFECGAKSQTTLGYSLDGRKDGAIEYINYFNEKLK